MVACAITGRKGLGLHYIANRTRAIEDEGLTATSNAKLASNAVSVTKIGYPRAGTKALIDNARVQVWDVSWPKGQPSPLHRHLYAMTGPLSPRRRSFRTVSTSPSTPRHRASDSA